MNWDIHRRERENAEVSQGRFTAADAGRLTSSE
jgi:hypothetical protein